LTQKTMRRTHETKPKRAKGANLAKKKKSHNPYGLEEMKDRGAIDLLTPGKHGTQNPNRGLITSFHSEKVKAPGRSHVGEERVPRLG